MNTIIINLGSELLKITNLMKKIISCEKAIELPNNTWLIVSDNDINWWNNYIFKQLEATYANLEQAGSIKKAYFITSGKDLCGLLDKGITDKLREIKKSSKPSKPELPKVQNILDRMDIEEKI